MRIKCQAGAIPESIKVDVSHLQVGEGIHVRDLVLPPDVTVDHDADLLLAHVVIRAVAGGSRSRRTAEAEAAAAQPEVIKPERKEKEKET